MARFATASQTSSKEDDWGVQLIARPGMQYSFPISGNRGYDSNRVCSLSNGNKYNHAVLWRGTTEHQDSRGNKTQGSQENTPSTGWAIGSTVAWVSSRKMIPGIHKSMDRQDERGAWAMLASEPKDSLFKQKGLWPARQGHPGCKTLQMWMAQAQPAASQIFWNGHPTGPFPGRGDASSGMGSDSYGALQTQGGVC